MLFKSVPRLLFTLVLAIGSQAAAQALPKLDAPLPSPEEMFERVRNNQKEIEAVARNYTYRKTLEKFKAGKDGKLFRESVREYDCYRIGSREVSRLIAVDGKPLSEKEAREAAEKAEESAERARRSEEKALRKHDDDDDELRISDVLAATEFKNGRWETIDGRAVAAYDFTPRTGGKLRNRAQKLANKLAGTIMVDPVAGQVVRVQARLVNSYKVGAGILGAVREGSQFTIDQQRVNNELWVPARIQVDMNYRLLFKGGSQYQVARFSDYQKFRVNHTYTVLGEPQP